MSNSYRYQFFVSIVENPGRKVPLVDDAFSSHEQETYPTVSRDENLKSFQFQPDRNYHVDLRQTYLALKLKFVKGCSYDNTEELEKNTNKSQKKLQEIRKREKVGRRSSSSGCSCEQHFAFILSQCWGVYHVSANLQF